MAGKKCINASMDKQTVENEFAYEYTRARIYAYLHALQPLSGCCISEEYQRGRELIAILAESSEGNGSPKRKLTIDECADVIAYMHSSEPRNRGAFCREPDGKPSIECGYHFVLFAVEKAIRNAANSRNAKKAA